MTQTDAALRAHNTRLDTLITFDHKTGVMAAYPRLGTLLIEKKRGAKPFSVVPNFCPFCGVRYGEGS